MRTITDHYDGHGLAESLRIESDDLAPTAGMAAHTYRVWIGDTKVADILFQQGPRNIEGSRPGGVLFAACGCGIISARVHALRSGRPAFQATGLGQNPCHGSRRDPCRDPGSRAANAIRTNGPDQIQITVFPKESRRRNLQCSDGSRCGDVLPGRKTSGQQRALQNL